MTTEVKAKSSLRVQLSSLAGFAEGLGYRPVDTKKGVMFVVSIDMHKDYKQIGLHSMVLLHNHVHNSGLKDGEFLYVEVAGKWFQFPLYFVNRAIAGKAVEAVDLRIDKDTNNWETNKEWVKFVNYSQPLLEKCLG